MCTPEGIRRWCEMLQLVRGVTVDGWVVRAPVGLASGQVAHVDPLRDESKWGTVPQC